MNHIKLGKYGEEKAVEYLLKNDFSIIERNYRYSNLEVDIIATKSNIIYFIEVKTRSSDLYGKPIEAVDRSKLNAIKKVANFYLENNLESNPKHQPLIKIQFDVISIKIKNLKTNDFELERTEDLF